VFGQDSKNEGGVYLKKARPLLPAKAQKENKKMGAKGLT
jgi:hypothetical protein